jgi:hypothetical protein
MISFLGLAVVVTIVVVATGLAVLGSQVYFGAGERPSCPTCGATLTDEEQECGVCEAPFETPAGPARQTQDDRTVTVNTSDDPDPDADVGTLNPGVTPRMIRWALIAMFVGIGVRVLGMLEPVGLEIGVPDSIGVALTVLGGIAMFVGFVVLDVA